MKIAFATDMNYFKATLVAVTSVLEHASRDVEVFVLGHNLSEPALALLKQIEVLYWVATVRHVPVTDDMLPDEMPTRNGETFPHLTTSCLMALWVPKLIGPGKVLYLDSDIIAHGDVSGLFDMNMDGNLIAAVRDPNSPRIIGEERVVGIMGTRPSEEYFNGGVVMFDCDRLRAEGLDEELAQISKVTEDYMFPDQDRMNSLFSGRCKMLSYQWNMQVYFETDGVFRSVWRIMGQDPMIQHFNSPMKPWLTLSDKLFEDKKLIEYGMDILNYRKMANRLLSKLFGIKASVTTQYDFKAAPPSDA